MTNLNDLFARDMAFRDIVIETAAHAIGSTSKEFTEEWLMAGGDNARSAKRAAAVERLRHIWKACIKDSRQLLSALVGKEGSPTYIERADYDALIDLLTDDDGVARSNDGVIAEHVDANDDLAPESDVIAGDVGANDANVTQDSREKLEADILEEHDSFIHTPWGFRRIRKWLDRQAAITRKTEQAAWIQQANGLIHEANARAEELREKVGEMTDEISELLKKQPYTFDPHDARKSIKLIGRYIDELQAKVDELTELNDYHALQYDLAYEDAERLQVQVDNLRDELAKRDKGIARLKRQRDEARQELEKRRWEYCETCEHAEHVDRLEAECDKLKRKEKQLSNELGLRDRAIELLQDVKQELIAERDNLAADLQDCERERERLRQALGIAIDHAHEIVALVDIDKEVAR